MALSTYSFDIRISEGVSFFVVPGCPFMALLGPSREVPRIILLLLFHTQFPLSGQNTPLKGEIVLPSESSSSSS